MTYKYTKLKKPKVTQKEAEMYELGRFDEANHNGERFRVKKNKNGFYESNPIGEHIFFLNQDSLDKFMASSNEHKSEVEISTTKLQEGAIPLELGSIIYDSDEHDELEMKSIPVREEGDVVRVKGSDLSEYTENIHYGHKIIKIEYQA